MNWTYIVRCGTFGLLTGLYSVAMTYITVGFPVTTGADKFRVVCLFIVSAVGGIFAFQRDPEKAWSAGPTILKCAVGLLVGAALLGGCAIYQAQTIDEYIKQTKALDGSGCVYVRGNARPYADVSVLSIATWGKNAPKYLECLQNIPPDARALLP